MQQSRQFNASYSAMQLNSLVQKSLQKITKLTLIMTSTKLSLTYAKKKENKMRSSQREQIEANMIV